MKILVLAIACLWVAGCAGAFLRHMPVQRVETPAVSTPESESDHRVTWGETACSLAGHYGVDVDALRSVNGLWEAPGLRLQTALGLTIPRTRPLFYEVARGDTVYRITTHYGIPAEALLTANEIADPDRLSVGQIVWVPAGARTGCAPSPRRLPTPVDRARAAAEAATDWAPAGGWLEVDALLERAREGYRAADFTHAIELAGAVRARLESAPAGKAVNARRARGEWIAASSWVGLERNDEALPHFAAALELDPTLPDAASASPKIRDLVEKVRTPE